MNTALVTGATSGVGREVAFDLVRRGWQLILPTRSEERVSAVVEMARVLGAPQPRIMICDLADPDQIRDMCAQVLGMAPIDVVINCAGVGMRDRETNERGIEMCMAVNAAAPHLIARALAPALSPTGRIVQVGSMGQAPVDLDDLNFDNDHDNIQAYCRSKVALLMSAVELAETGIPVNVVHPANEMPTRMVLESGFPIASTLDDGVLPVLRVALDSKIADLRGVYFDRFDIAEPHPQVLDPVARKKVVTWLDEITA